MIIIDIFIEILLYKIHIEITGNNLVFFWPDLPPPDEDKDRTAGKFASYVNQLQSSQPDSHNDSNN